LHREIGISREDRLQDLHEALTMLVSDERARGQFLQDPERWAAERGLSAQERQALAALDGASLERYAESLLDKRTSELLSAIPCTSRLFPPLAGLYRRWLARHPSPPHDERLSPGLAEALRALPALVRQVEPEWLAEMLVYEVLWRCSRRDGRPRWLQARWPQHRLLQEVSQGEIPLDPDEEPRRYVFP
jgi:hypothetical protein